MFRVSRNQYMMQDYGDFFDVDRNGEISNMILIKKVHMEKQYKYANIFLIEKIVYMILL